MKNQRENKYFLFEKDFLSAGVGFRQAFYVAVFVIGLLSLSNLSCSSQYAQTAVNSAPNHLPSMSNSLLNTKDSANVETEERLIETVFEDSNVGVSRKNKVELSWFQKAYENRVELKFYSLAKGNEWQLKQTTEVKKYGGLPLEMQITDFNNDGLKDVTFVSGIAARGANEVKSLFIYDRQADQLIYIKNSEEYPNLFYNKSLNCIDSLIFTGSTSTSFLRIEQDILVEFASIEIHDTAMERLVYLIDKTGKQKLLRRDKITKDEIFARYKTFNPPTIYKEEELEQ